MCTTELALRLFQSCTFLISSSKEKSIIRALLMPRTHRDDYHLLSRDQQVVLGRLHTGHNRLNDHMYRELNLVPSSSCPCGQEDQTTEQVLQRCPLHQAARQDVWLTDTDDQTLQPQTSWSRWPLIINLSSELN